MWEPLGCVALASPIVAEVVLAVVEEVQLVVYPPFFKLGIPCIQNPRRQ